MNFVKTFGMCGALMALAVGSGCGAADASDSSVEANGADESGTAQQDLSATTCKPTYVLFNSGLNLIGTSGSINYVAPSGSNRLLIQGRSASGFTVSGYIDLAGMTVSGSWGTMGGMGTITEITISGLTMTISGRSGTSIFNQTSKTSTITFSGPVSFSFGSIAGSNINEIIPYPATSSGTGLTFGATGSGYTFTSNATLTCP